MLCARAFLVALVAIGASLPSSSRALAVKFALDEPFTSGRQSLMAQLDGDPALEIVVAKTVHLVVFDGETGAQEFFYSYSTSGSDPTCMVMDVDADGLVELIAGHANRMVVVDTDGGPTGAAETYAEPGGLRLGQSRPNPTRRDATMALSLERRSVVTLDVYNVAGRRVRRLLDAMVLEPGHHDFLWDGTNDTGHRVVSGQYYCVARTPDEQATKRMVVLR